MTIVPITTQSLRRNDGLKTNVKPSLRHYTNRQTRIQIVLIVRPTNITSDSFQILFQHPDVFSFTNRFKDIRPDRGAHLAQVRGP